MDAQVAVAVLALCLTAVVAAEGGDLQPKPVPRMQAVPQPYHQVSFQRDGQEIARYHFGPDLDRPFLFPIVGPAGRSLTRMGHPHDPESHGHHNSVWTSHQSVNGTNFWENGRGGRIVHQSIELLDDGPERALLIVHNAWKDKDGKTLLNERRQIAVHDLPKGEWLLVVDLELAPGDADATLGKTPFGLFAVRMARSLGVHDSGGTIRNSEGGVDEKGVFWKPARWVDYSGAIAPGAVEGLTLFDHPSNPNHPSTFHVRNDGWMGSCLTFDGPRTIKAGEALRLRYGLYVHAGLPSLDELQARWTAFTQLPPAGPAKGKR